ncbi:hypothetical protein [Pseudomonas asplenii]|uniref:Uncharacterized protein n=1 Tax=Pseudomonas asplenii TaxID=53407 RepID=A0A1H6P4T1_9PSED|nr:hypothetical protein [Pseudomonas fuscovaginae]SEI24504.1 hypothetical protein SAMN05216581_5520 [Pseudomonas fuscovaginae]
MVWGGNTQFIGGQEFMNNSPVINYLKNAPLFNWSSAPQPAGSK